MAAGRAHQLNELGPHRFTGRPAAHRTTPRVLREHCNDPDWEPQTAKEQRDNGTDDMVDSIAHKEPLLLAMRTKSAVIFHAYIISFATGEGLSTPFPSGGNSVPILLTSKT
jgi:hypothetical protein